MRVRVREEKGQWWAACPGRWQALEISRRGWRGRITCRVEAATFGGHGAVKGSGLFPKPGSGGPRWTQAAAVRWLCGACGLEHSPDEHCRLPPPQNDGGTESRPGLALGHCA